MGDAEHATGDELSDGVRPQSGSSTESPLSSPPDQESAARLAAAMRRPFSGLMVVALVLAVAGILAGGLLFYDAQREQLRAAAEAELLSIAQLKVDQITNWLHERTGDAGVLMERPTVVGALDRYLEAPTEQDKETLLAQLKILQERYGYADAFLVDADGNVRLTLSGSTAPLHEAEQQSLASAFEQRAPAMVELHRNGGDPHFGVVAPYFTAEQGTGTPVGAIILDIEASRFLYPLIQSWPVPSETAETLIVRKDGDDVLFLNDLRFLQDAALNLRIPLSQTTLPAVMAVQDTEGLLQGIDYRGVPVIAVAEPIAGTSWFMVAKIDEAEVFSGWRVEAALIGFLTFAILLGALALGAFVWQRRTQAALTRTAALLERRVQERTRDLQESNRELEAFAYSVSHDLRSPLRAIDGFSRIIMDDYAEALDNEGRRLLNVVRTSAQHMDNLISDLLEMSRVGRRHMNMTTVDMAALATHVFNDVASEQVKQAFEFQVDALPPVQGDPVLLRLVFQNLIANAIKFTLPSETRTIHVGGKAGDGSNVYYVKDTGMGFDQRYADNLFRPFERLHSSSEFEGTGIGLAIVERAVKRHGGRVWAESHPSEGATFYFELPVKGEGHANRRTGS